MRGRRATRQTAAVTSSKHVVYGNLLKLDLDLDLDLGLDLDPDPDSDQDPGAVHPGLSPGPRPGATPCVFGPTRIRIRISNLTLTQT